LKSSPRAITSVAISTHVSPVRKRATALSLGGWLGVKFGGAQGG
jgi:hypothetical protein